MNSEQALAPEAAPLELGASGATAARALEPSAAFWFTMFAASALGTNVGDFWADDLSFGLIGSFVTLAIISILLIWGDRRNGLKTGVFFWLAIIFLRAGATNIGDLLTHKMGIGYVLASVALGAVTVWLGRFTLPALSTAASPLIDLRYWAAMFVGGVFGTVAGDLVSHAIGLFPSMLLLDTALVLVILSRKAFAPTALVGYWCIVLAERAAGTPTGDWLAEGVALGLPMAMACTGAMVLAGLGLRQFRD